MPPVIPAAKLSPTSPKITTIPPVIYSQPFESPPSIAVVEGCDSNGCEYMTGGNVIILGGTGDNFAAGMTGGMAFIYDKSHQFTKKVNPESVVWQTVETDYWKEILKNLISEHSKETGSEFSRNIIKNYDEELINFVQVCPKEMLDKLDNPITLKDIKKVS